MNKDDTLTIAAWRHLVGITEMPVSLRRYFNLINEANIHCQIVKQVSGLSGSECHEVPSSQELLVSNVASRQNHKKYTDTDRLGHIIHRIYLASTGPLCSSQISKLSNPREDQFFWNIRYLQISGNEQPIAFFLVVSLPVMSPTARSSSLSSIV